ncbi:hypothetical protein ABW20_dc0101249 [Dactylellina cionopaga]|nr:hypothetical protein ABW20_dc0101249 [Dactylellina cionopaga]
MRSSNILLGLALSAVSTIAAPPQELRDWYVKARRDIDHEDGSQGGPRYNIHAPVPTHVIKITQGGTVVSTLVYRRDANMFGTGGTGTGGVPPMETGTMSMSSESSTSTNETGMMNSTTSMSSTMSYTMSSSMMSSTVSVMPTASMSSAESMDMSISTTSTMVDTVMSSTDSTSIMTDASTSSMSPTTTGNSISSPTSMTEEYTSPISLIPESSSPELTTTLTFHVTLDPTSTEFSTSVMTTSQSSSMISEPSTSSTMSSISTDMASTDMMSTTKMTTTFSSSTSTTTTSTTTTSTSSSSTPAMTTMSSSSSSTYVMATSSSLSSFNSSTTTMTSESTAMANPPIAAITSTKSATESRPTHSTIARPLRGKSWFDGTNPRRIYISHHIFEAGQDNKSLDEQRTEIVNSMVDAKFLLERQEILRNKKDIQCSVPSSKESHLLYCNSRSHFGIRLANQSPDLWKSKCVDAGIMAVFLAQAITNTTVLDINIDAKEIPLGEPPAGYFQSPTILADKALGRTWDTFGQSFWSPQVQRLVFITREEKCVMGNGVTEKGSNGYLFLNGLV